MTGETLAVKLVLVLPAGTITEAGTATATLLLPRLTGSPPVSAVAFKVIEQVSVPAPIIEPLEQLRPVSTGTPVPLKPSEVEVAAVESLVTVSWPVAEPVDVGLNCIVRVKLPFALIVAGRPVCPLAEKDCPLTFSWVTFMGAELSFVSVTLSFAVWPTATAPKATLLEDATRVPVEALVPVLFVAIEPAQPLRTRPLEMIVRRPIRPRNKCLIRALSKLAVCTKVTI